MTSVNIAASEPNKPANPSQPSQVLQQNQQPGQQSQQQGGRPNKDKPAPSAGPFATSEKHNDPILGGAAPPIATVTGASTAIYNPPSDGFPFVAAVFSPDGAIQAFRTFSNRRDAEGFLQAFMQEGAGEYGLG